MRHADPLELASAVKRIVGGSSLSEKFERVGVEAGDYNDESNFLRILLFLRDTKNISDEDVDSLTSSIEIEISKIDDRFPSVRFAER